MKQQKKTTTTKPEKPVGHHETELVVKMNAVTSFSICKKHLHAYFKGVL